jgi:tetrahydrofolate dehydrogenase/cyclohydrolase, NAD(P)-binding domain protein
MKKRIQQIIDKNIEKKIELIKSLRGKEDKDNPIMEFNNNYKDKILTLIVDDKNINSLYVKAIQSTFKKYLPDAIIKFVNVNEKMSRTDIAIKLLSEVDLLTELNGYLFIQPSITGQKTICIKRDLDNIENYNDLWNKFNLTITSQVISEIIEEYVKDIKNPNIVIIGDGLTVGKPLNLWCQQHQDWNTYQIKECFKEKYDDIPDEFKDKILENADIIISATGNAESLMVDNVAVISPTIYYEAYSGTYVHDLYRGCTNSCDTHTVLNSIGTLTNLELCIRWLNNVLGIDSNDRFTIGK